MVDTLAPWLIGNELMSIGVLRSVYQVFSEIELHGNGMFGSWILATFSNDTSSATKNHQNLCA